MRQRLGLDDTAAEAIFPSPFRYREQAMLYIAEDLPDPTHDGFAQAAAKRAIELCRLSRGRALLLFTSFRGMRVAEEHFRADGSFPLLVQGERPRQARQIRRRPTTLLRPVRISGTSGGRGESPPCLRQRSIRSS